jgi:hypothetical protein
MEEIKLLGVSGNAGAGKDTFIDILINVSRLPIKKIALAESLKSDMRTQILEKYGIDIFSCSRQEKNSIRHLLVKYGKDRRAETRGTYLIEKTRPEILKSIKNNIIPAISDVRYREFEYDEHIFIKEMGGILIYIERIAPDGSIVPPANEEETKNNMKDFADHYISWNTFNHEDGKIDVEHHAEAVKHIHDFLKEYGERLNKIWWNVMKTHLN